MKIKQLVHDSATAVDEMLEGMVTAHKHLVLVKEERVLLHRDFKTIRERQVTLLSGGGSGHEPAHAGYIGEGMLTGAICGGIFASPSTGQVLAAIR
jgi:dihydroxyacetone kinase